MYKQLAQMRMDQNRWAISHVDEVRVEYSGAVVV